MYIDKDATFMIESGQNRKIAALRSSKCVRLFWRFYMDEYFMNEAIQEAKLCLLTDDVPVGAVVVKDGIIIGRGHNCKEKEQNATRHAEIIAIEEACRYENNWHLDGCTLYVTLEPCLMCSGAIIQSRISRLVYATESEKFGYIESIDSVLTNSKNNHSVIIEKGICKGECQKLIKDFFKEKRESR